MAASDPPDGGKRRRRLRGALLLVGCVLLFECGVARRPNVRKAVITTPVRTLERALLAAETPPQLVVFGNSRMLYGVDERQLAAEAGLPRSAVLKLAMNGTSVSQYLYLYRRNRAKLSQAGQVIIGVDTWDLSHGCRWWPEDAYSATLRERLTALDWRYAPLGLLTWACQSTCLLGPVLRSGAQRLRARLGHPAEEPVVPPGRREQEGLFGERDPGLERRWASGQWYAEPHRPGQALHLTPRVVIHRNFGWLPAPSEGSYRQLQCLVRMCLEDGAKVLIVRPPLRDDYLQLEGRDYEPYVAAFERRAAALRGWAAGSGGRLEVRLYGAASAVGLPINAFYDYGHPSPLGRRYLSSQLAAWVCEAGGAAAARRDPETATRGGRPEP